MRLGFFFGAGAEICYGLPSGGQFALDLFRQDLSGEKTALREQLQNQIDRQSNYATDWLHESFFRKRIHAFGKNEFSFLIESSIEYKKKELIRKLNGFDIEVDQALEQLGIQRAVIAQKFQDTFQYALGERRYSQVIQVNPLLSDQIQMFGSEFYSAILDLLRSDIDTSYLQRYASAFLQLLVGAHGQNLIQRLNQEIFTEAPDDIPIFDDIGGIFRLEFSRVGLTALELLLEDRRAFTINDDTPLIDLMCVVAQKVMENLFTSVMDYQSLIDAHFRYLYAPKTEWAKFTKMIVFLRAARRYISERLPQIAEIPQSGYYHDLQFCERMGVEITAIGTANYNSLIERILQGLGAEFPEVMHLNGSVNDFYNPYKNTVIHCPDEGQVPTDQIHVPFILTQSGLKPLTSVDMSRRYVSLFDGYSESDAIVVVGYGFNVDDGHINGLFRKLIEEENKELFWIVPSSEGTVAQLERELLRKLRISPRFNNKIHVITVDTASRNSGDVLWLEAIRARLQTQAAA